MSVVAPSAVDRSRGDLPARADWAAGRSTDATAVLNASSSAIVAFLPSSCAAVHFPIASPAAKLSVAKVMSTVSAGSGGVSSAMTYRPCWRALFSAVLMPGPFGVIRMPWSPRAMASSIAAIWVCSSPSSLPAAVVILTPSALPAFFAPSCMVTKNGLVSVLVIRPMLTSSAVPPVSSPERGLDRGNFRRASALLDEAGWIASEWRSSDNNRRARYYKITAAGHRQLADETAEWARASGAIGRVLRLA